MGAFRQIQIVRYLATIKMPVIIVEELNKKIII